MPRGGECFGGVYRIHRAPGLREGAVPVELSGVREQHGRGRLHPMHFRFSFLCASLLFALGCSGSDDSTPAAPADSGSVDATTDTKPGPGADTGPNTTDTGTTEDSAGIKCGEKVCGTGQVCCVNGDVDSGFDLACAASCPDGGASLSCDGPEDCAAGAGICCAEVDVGGSGLACTFKTGVAECRASCASSIPTMCPGKAKVRRCHKKSDCAEADYANCCEFESGGTSATFCVADWMKLAAAGCVE